MTIPDFAALCLIGIDFWLAIRWAEGEGRA